MSKFLGVNMPKLINKAMGKLLLEGTLTKITRSARTDGSLTSGPSKTESSYSFRGFYEEYRDGAVDGALIKDGDRKAVILSDSLSSAVVPGMGDTITLEGETKTIVGEIKRDPAGAVYKCQVR